MGMGVLSQCSELLGSRMGKTPTGSVGMLMAQVSTLEQLIFDSESTLLGKVLQRGTTMEANRN